MGLPQEILEKFICKLNIRVRDGKLYYPEVMWAIFYKFTGTYNRELNTSREQKQILMNLKILYCGIDKKMTLKQLFGLEKYTHEINMESYVQGKKILKAYENYKNREMFKFLINRGIEKKLKL